MGGQNVGLFYGCFIFASLLCFIEVSSAPTLQILDAMKSDKQICESAKFLYETNYTDVCRSLNMVASPAELPVRHENVNTLLCLSVYDAAYKICSYSGDWENKLKNASMFFSYVQKLFPQKGQEEKFCSDLNNIVPMYEKTKPLLMPFVEKLNDKFHCHEICFGLDDLFNPLCGMLAWIKNVDENVQRVRAAKVTVQTVGGPGEDKMQEEIGKDKEEKEGKNEEGSQGKPENVNDKQQVGSKAAEPNPNDASADARQKDTATLNTISTQDKPKPQNTPDQPGSNEKYGTESEPAPSDQGHKSANKADLNLQNKSVPSSIEGSNVVGSTIPKTVSENTEIDNQSPKHTDSDVPTILNNNNINSGNNMKPKQSGAELNEEPKHSGISDNAQDRDGMDNIEDPSRIDDQPYGNDGDDDVMSEPSTRDRILPESSEQKELLPRYRSIGNEDESHFFTYFTVISLVCIVGYIGYHNKQKILAIVLEGRRSKSSRGRRRPSTASYRKLDCTLEEAVTSQCNANVTHVIY